MAKVEMKQPVVKEISDRIDGARSIVLVDHRGLTVAQDTELRKSLREAGVTYKVFKNTMMTLAFKDTEFEQLDKYLEGPSAMAVSKDDSMAIAKILANFAKKNEKLEIKGGMVEGQLYDASGIAMIATVPSKEELLARLFGSFQAPITNFARVIKQIAEKSAEGAPAAEVPAAEAPVTEAPVAEAPAAEAAPQA
jgi:large subunit ribosomal protein L10